jgi:predicted AAA+ superfamily ATPase
MVRPMSSDSVTPPLLRRSITDLAVDYLSTFRVVILNGPRQAGKTTLLSQLSSIRPGEMRTLDDETHLQAALSDPVGFVAAAGGPLFIDEVQRGGEPLIRAIKAIVDRHREPGQFVLAGSTRFLREPSLNESLAGRAGVLDVLPMSHGEFSSQRDRFIEVALTEPDAMRTFGPTGYRRAQYPDVIVRGGFHEPATMDSSRMRNAWFRNFVAAVTDRDIREIGRVNEPSAAGRVLRGLAAMSGQLLVTTTLSERSELSRAAVDRYTELLDAVFLIHRLPPWSRNVLNRAVRHPKVYLADTGLLAHVLGASTASLSSPASPHRGALVETFVVNELRKQLTWADVEAQLFHYRDQQGRSEVDVIVEAADGSLVAIEVKAAQSVAAADLRHLAGLRDKLGTAFRHGFLVYLGDAAVSFGERLSAVPLASLWAAPGMRTPS